MTRTQKLLIVLGLSLIGGAVMAARDRVEYYGGAFPVWFNKGVYVSSNVPDLTLDTKNKVTRLVGCTIDYDFPAPKGPGWEFYTPAMTCTGVKLGDPCFLGVAAITPADAGSGYANLLTYVPIAVADNQVKIRETMTGGGDGGTMNQSDAGYNVRCISNQ